MLYAIWVSWTAYLKWTRSADIHCAVVLENHDTIDCQTYTAKLELRLSLLSYMEIVTGKDGGSLWFIGVLS